MKRRVDFQIASLDLTREREFRDRCKPHRVTIELLNKHNPRIAYWRMFCLKTEAVRTMGFDVDVVRTLDRMDAGEAFAAIDLYAARGVSKSSSPSNLTGGPFCVVCDTPGGLPCPTMVRQALKLGIKLAYPPDDARLVPNHVHPGRCRKRLRALLDSSANKAPGT